MRNPTEPELIAIRAAILSADDAAYALQRAGKELRWKHNEQGNSSVDPATGEWMEPQRTDQGVAWAPTGRSVNAEDMTRMSAIIETDVNAQAAALQARRMLYVKCSAPAHAILDHCGQWIKNVKGEPVRLVSGNNKKHGKTK